MNLIRENEEDDQKEKKEIDNDDKSEILLGNISEKETFDDIYEKESELSEEDEKARVEKRAHSYADALNQIEKKLNAETDARIQAEQNLQAEIEERTKTKEKAKSFEETSQEILTA